MAVRLEALKSRRNPTRSDIVYGISVCFALLILCLIGGWWQKAQADGVSARADDWFTINKDYSSQRYVGLDQITPQNVGKLKEVCEIQLNEPNLFSSGILKVGRTLYTSTSLQTVCVRRDDLCFALARNGHLPEGAGLGQSPWSRLSRRQDLSRYGRWAIDRI